MSEDEPRKLKRAELAARLAEAIRENDQLKAELATARAQLADRTVEVSDAGSIAEASLKLNDVFTAAQSAADQYLDNIERLYRGRGELVREAQSKAQAILAQAQIDAEDAVSQAKAEAEAARKRAEGAQADADAVLADARARAQAMAELSQGQAQAAADRVLADAQARAGEILAQAREEARRVLADARQTAQARMEEAERVSRNLELATKVRCDNTLRRASNEAHVYGDTLRMALQALGITPEMVPALEEATGMKVGENLPFPQMEAEPPLEGVQGASQAAKPVEAGGPGPADADGEPVADGDGERGAGSDDDSPADADDALSPDAEGGRGGDDLDGPDAARGPAGDGEPRSASGDAVADLDQAVSSARAAVAAAIGTARTAPGTIDHESLVAMYPNSAKEL